VLAIGYELYWQWVEGLPPEEDAAEEGKPAKKAAAS